MTLSKTVLTALACGLVSLFPGLANAATAGEVSTCGLVLEARFIEGAPRDRFTFANRSTAAWNITNLSLDLSASKGRLIFDTVDGGTGVEVFQPFRDEGGSALLSQLPNLADGDSALSLDFQKFDQGLSYQFSIDVDDTLNDSELGQIRVSGAEIAGAVLSVNLTSPRGEAVSLTTTFSESATADLGDKACT